MLGSKWIIVGTAALVLAGCDTKSSVEFKGTRGTASAAKTVYESLAPNQGGVFSAPTTSGSFVNGTFVTTTTSGLYKVSITMGAGNSGSTGTTASNYQVKMNLQGQNSQ